MAEHVAQAQEHDHHGDGEQECHPVTQPSRDRLWQAPTTTLGTVLCAVVGGLIVWLLVTGLPYLIAHVNVSISWH
jgi:hypothetical protein